MAGQGSARRSLRLAVQRLHALLLLAVLLVGGCQSPRQFDDDAITVTPLQPGATRPARPAGDTAPVAPPPGEVTTNTRKVSTGAGSFSTTIVEAPLAAIRLKLGLARDRVGCTEALSAIAQRHGAVAAINGCFFDAYSSRAVRNPYGVLITNGAVLHVSDHPTTLAYWADGTVAVAKVEFKITGGLDGRESWPHNWYAYGLNDYPEGGTWATIYLPAWAKQQTPSDGMQVVVRGGQVVSKGPGSQSIPADGFVLYFRGGEKYLADRFSPGMQCSYRVTVKWSKPQLDWRTVQEALGCGPLLVRNGSVAVDAPAEGFKDPKVLTNAGDRSAVGVTPDARLLLVTCRSATIKQLAAVMAALGCLDAMNLDGGASSGLWFRGKYLTAPGRDISNALLVLSR
jgi:exopolysaccharide biosynthesis protein